MDTRCALHSSRVAGWSCEACARALCIQCAATGLQGLPVCATCGHLVAPIQVPRAVVFPFRTVWPQALEPLKTVRGVTQVVVVAVAVQLLLALGPRLWLLGRALELGWILFLARRAGVGFDPFGVPRYQDLGSVWVGPFPRFLASSGLVLGASAWLARLGQVAVPWTNLWAWVAAAVCIAVLPPALVAASVEGEGKGIVWPWQLASWGRRMGSDLVPLMWVTGLVVLMELVDGRLAPFSLEDTKLDWHIVQAFVPRLISLFALAAVGSLAGTLVYTRATELGHGEPEVDLVPRLLEAPEGKWVPPARDPALVAAEAAQRFAPIELGNPRDTVVAAIARKDVDAALAGLRSGDVNASTLEASDLIALAQLVAGRGDASLAAQLLRGVVVRPVDVHTPRALVILARLCVEKLGEPAEGRACFERVLREFPQSPAAEFARQRLQSRDGA